MKFNVNHYVRVKVNAIGIAILKERHDHLREVVSSAGEFKPPPIDDEGYSSFQLWDLMMVFGPRIHMGCRMPFDTSMDIREGQL